MGTATIVGVVIIVGLVVVVWATLWLSRKVQKAQGRDTCSFCGAPLEQVGMDYVTHSASCGRQQPWDTDSDA